LPDVSVVIPTKDRLPYLRRAIALFLANPEVGEIIVVVDGCVDGTLDYVKEVNAQNERIRYVDNGQNRGTPYSRNVGARLARYDYVFTGEDDLEIPDSFFQTLLAHMKVSGADIISARNIFRLETETADQALLRMAQAKGDAVNARTLEVNTGMPADEDRTQLLLPAPMLCKREIFRSVHWDERYRVNFWREETDFQLSAHERGYRLVYCPHTASFNFEIANDRGGAHAAVGLKRVVWVVRNNWRFVTKHRDLIAAEFDMGNIHAYIVRFAIKRFWVEFAIPTLTRPLLLARTALRKAGGVGH
jgi:glycosyltransferase involved in cell wall biosynthesis